jgi:hypothetical protein
MRIRRPDGEIRYLDCHAEITADADGRRQRPIGTNLDITEQVLAKSGWPTWRASTPCSARPTQPSWIRRDSAQLLQTGVASWSRIGGLVMAWTCRMADGKPTHVTHWGHEDG